MSDEKNLVQQPETEIEAETTEINDEALDDVAGGLNPQPLPPRGRR